MLQVQKNKAIFSSNHTNNNGVKHTCRVLTCSDVSWTCDRRRREICIDNFPPPLYRSYTRIEERCVMSKQVWKAFPKQCVCALAITKFVDFF
jgi:hypothetical protein